MPAATPFSIYATSSPEQIEYVVGDAGARIVLTEQAHLDQVLAARERLGGQVEHVIVVDARWLRRQGAPARWPTAGRRAAGAASGFDVEASRGRARPRGRADAHLHVGHHRAARRA